MLYYVYDQRWSRGIDDVIMKLLIQRARADSKMERPGTRAICFVPPPAPSESGGGGVVFLRLADSQFARDANFFLPNNTIAAA